MRIEPTIYLVGEEGALKRRVLVRAEGAIVRAVGDGFEVSAPVQGGVAVLDIPEREAPQDVRFACGSDEQLATIQPQKQWEIYFVPISHHDYGYTVPAEEVLWQYDGFYRLMLRYLDETSGYPEPARYRYTIEGMWSLAHFLRNCTDAERQSLIEYCKQGRVEVLAFWGNTAEVHCEHEELIRMLYAAFELKREHGIPISGGAMTDMAGQGWGLPKLMAGAGLKYLFNGMPSYFTWDEICGVHGAPIVHSYWDESSVLRHGTPDAYQWEAQDGGRIMSYYQGSYGWFMGWRAQEQEVELPESIADIEAHLPGILQDIEGRDVPFDVLRYIDHGVDNHAPVVAISNIVREWNARYAWPKLRVGTNVEFMERFMRTCGELPVQRGEIPHTEYGYATMSFARESAENFRNQNRARVAETMSSIREQLLGAPSAAAKMAGIYEDILSFDEHCYGMAMPYGADFDYNWSTKAHHVWRARADAESLTRQATGALTAKIQPVGDARFIAVFNTLSFARDGIVRAEECPFEPRDYQLIDLATGQGVPFEWRIIDRFDLPEPMAAERYTFHRMGDPEAHLARELVFFAKDVPAMGWRGYALRPTEKPAGEPVLPQTPKQERVLENAFYRVEFAPDGRITSVCDRQLGKELVDASCAHPFAGVVARDCHTQQVHPTEYLGVELLPGGPVAKTALVKFAAVGAPRGAMSVTLYENVKRIDFKLKLLYDGTPVNELFWALPLDIDSPRFEYEGALCRPTPWRDQFPGSNTNYYVIRNWASSANDGVKAVISPTETRVVDFGGLWNSYVSQAHHAVHPVDYGAPFARREDVKKGHMYMLLAFNNIRTNFRMTQNGEVCYSCSLTTGAPDDVSPTAFGWGVQQPLLAGQRMGAGAGELPARGSFAEVDAPNAMLVLKSAEDGNGLIVRLMETEGLRAQARVCFPGRALESVTQTNLVEEDEAAVPVLGDGFAAALSPYGIHTFRVRFAHRAEGSR